MFPTFFPILTLFVLFGIYRIHQRVFRITVVIYLISMLLGWMIIIAGYTGFIEKTLLYTLLTGIGFMEALIALFIALFSNQKNLYSDLPPRHE